MKNKLLISMFALSVMATGATKLQAQSVQVNNGPELPFNPDNNFNRAVDGDENSFYCYRVRSKGKGTSYSIEKYDKKTMKLVFSKEIDMSEERTWFVNALYGNDQINVFSQHYVKEGEKMILQVQTISNTGAVSSKKTDVTTLITDHYEFVQFDLTLNAARTKMVVKAVCKPNKDSEYTTKFILVNLSDMKTEWSKQINGGLYSGSVHLGPTVTVYGFGGKTEKQEYKFLGSSLDNKDNYYYAYEELINKPDKNSKEKKKDKDKDKDKEKANVNVYALKFAALESTESEPQVLEIPFEGAYSVYNIKFTKTKDNVVMAGFLTEYFDKDEKKKNAKEKKYIKCGIFSIIIDLTDMKVVSNPVKMFDDKLLSALDCTEKNASNYNYKLDYIYTIGEDIFYVGQQYSLTITYTQRSGMGFGAGGVSYNSRVPTAYDYHYRDVIVAKQNSSGNFEWISNAPMRSHTHMAFGHIYKQYFAVPSGKNIYIFNNDHPKNLELYQSSDYDPGDLKFVTGIHGSAFVYSAVSTSTGRFIHKLIFNNDTYCFAPVQENNPQFAPPENCEIFVPGTNGEYYVYTEDKGKDRFVKLKIVE